MGELFRIVLTTFILVFAVGTAADNQLTRVQIGLGEKVSDSDVPLLLHNKPVLVSAAFLEVAGLNGTVRAPEAPVDNVLREARRSSIEFFENSLAGNRKFIQNFLNKHSFEEIRHDKELQEQALSLIRLANQIEIGLEDLRAGVPIVYGLEVTGTEQSIQSLKGEGELFSFGRPTASKRERMEAVKPRGLFNQPRDDSFKPPNNLQELYELMISKGQEESEVLNLP